MSATVRCQLESGDIAPSDYLRARLAARDTAFWSRWAMRTLFLFGAAFLSAAIVTFVAHNWVYLSTVAKLGLLGALLLASAVGWVLKGFDSALAQTLGILATLLIGVWLAAAGQLYQAGGGFPQLVWRWTLLAIPFALASRSAAHHGAWATLAFASALTAFGTGINAFDDSAILLAQVAVGAGLTAWPVAASRGTDMHPVRVWMVWLGATLLVIAGTVGMLGRDELIWLIATAVAAVATVILYIGRKHLAATVLCGGALFGLVLVMVFRLASEMGGDIISILFVFVTTAALTGGFIVFASRASEAVTGEREGVWYIDVMTALGAALTALFGVMLIGSVLGLPIMAVFGDIGTPLLVIGLVVYGLSLLAILRLKSTFLRSMAVATLFVGIGSILSGAGILAIEDTFNFDTFRVALATTALAVTLPAILLAKHRVVEVLGTLIVVSALLSFFVTDSSDLVVAWQEVGAFALFAALGLAALTRPVGRYVFMAAGTVLLTAAAIDPLGSVENLFASAFGGETDATTDWRLASLLIAGRFAVLAASLAYLKTQTIRAALPSWLVLLPLIAVASILPAGGAQSVLVLLVGYALGSRALGLLGSLMLAWYMFRAFYDLELSLMQISGAYALTGIVILAVWMRVRPRDTSEALA